MFLPQSHMFPQISIGGQRESGSSDAKPGRDGRPKQTTVLGTRIKLVGVAVGISEALDCAVEEARGAGAASQK